MTLVAAIDIGTNSMRMLISDGVTEIGRWERVTGLGRGVDRTGVLAEGPMEETLEVLAEYGRLMEQHGVVRRMAIATSASRDASNREVFFDRAGSALGVRPVLITGDQEARYAFDGATGWYRGPQPVVVSDIGGGSTEFVTAEGGISVDIGSVRLTERALPNRPVEPGDVDRARETLREMFATVSIPTGASLLGVAGTWTEIPALVGDLPADTDTHSMTVTAADVTAVVEMLASLTVAETALLPSLNPKRAPVILGGALIAEAAVAVVGVDEVTVSVHDSLDGVVASLLALP